MPQDVIRAEKTGLWILNFGLITAVVLPRLKISTVFLIVFDCVYFRGMYKTQKIFFTLFEELLVLYRSGHSDF